MMFGLDVLLCGVAMSLTAQLIGSAADMLSHTQRNALKPVLNRAFRAMLVQTAGGLKWSERRKVGKLWAAFIRHEDIGRKLVSMVLRAGADLAHEVTSQAIPADLLTTFTQVAKSKGHLGVRIPPAASLTSFLAAFSEALEEEARKPNNALHEWVTNEKLNLVVELLRSGPALAPDGGTGAREPRAPGDHESEGSQPDAPPHLGADLADFTGRQTQVDKLVALLKKPGGQAVIEGMAGVGKTVLAVHVGHKLLRAYPDGQVQVNLEGFGKEPPLTPREAMGRIIRMFHPDTRLPEDDQAIAAAYRNALADKQALVLLDNAADASQVKPLLAGPPCAFVVTSRRRIVLPGLKLVDLDTMPGNEARDLLRSIVGEARATDAELDRIASLCGYLPLALRTAGTFLDVYGDWTAGVYADALEAHREHLAEKLKLKDHDLDVEAVLGFSARRQVEEDADLAAKWQMLTVFRATFERWAVAAVWDTDEETAHEGLGKLRARNLLIYDAEATRYRFHDLMRSVARKAFTYGEGPVDYEAEAKRIDEAAARHAEHYVQVLRAANRLYLEGDEGIGLGLATADLEWDNILAGQAWAAAHAKTDERAANLCNDYPGAGAYVLALRLHARVWIQWLEAAVAAARRLEDRRAEGNHLGSLGLAYANLGEVRRAIEYYEQCLGIHRQIGDRHGEGNALGNLGNAYADLGEVRRAIQYFEQQLAITREIVDRRGEGNALGNLGVAYANLGDVRRAIQYYEQHLAITRQIGDRRGEGNALGNLGNAYADLGDMRRAIEYYEQCLDIHREIGDRRGEGNALGNLGNAHYRLGDVRRAIEYYEQALVIDREIGDRRGEGNTLGNLGVAYADLREVRRAIECYEQALMIAREIGYRRGEGNTLGNLGVAYADLGEVRRAIEYYEQQLGIAREIGDRRGEGNALFNMSGELYKVGQREEAIVQARTALAILEAIEDPNAAKVRRQLEQWGTS